MRIDAYNQIAQIYGAQSTNRTTKSQAAGSIYGNDQVSISRTGYDFQIAKKAVSEASDIREDKVAQIKSMVDAGTYKVEEGDFAAKLLEKYNATLF